MIDDNEVERRSTRTLDDGIHIGKTIQLYTPAVSGATIVVMYFCLKDGMAHIKRFIRVEKDNRS
uniref:hypothetical protein n=1 Tax=Salmonella enterica TaxID=28901 RepID=UPI0020C305B6